jgi:hypothetical protein
MARKLLIALWRYVETGVTLDGVEFRAEAEILPDMHSLRTLFP